MTWTATDWLNSQPLELGKLRGRVVVLHFYTFGCINCIHNYPSYRNWQESLAGKNVTMLGIHTPETSGERVIETIRKKHQNNGFNNIRFFPVLSHTFGTFSILESFRISIEIGSPSLISL